MSCCQVRSRYQSKLKVGLHETFSLPLIREYEFAAAILEDLAWLGLDWDGPVRVQSAHLTEYQAALIKLDSPGRA